jgi:hypothetical protein
MSFIGFLSPIFLSLRPTSRIASRESDMNYLVDLDHTHSVIRLTVTAEIITLEMAEDCYVHLKRVTSDDGPYAAIYDLSVPKSTTIPTDMARALARLRPSIPMGRPHVVVGKEPVIYGLARLFQMCREHLHGRFEVVWTLQKAYDMVGCGPEDFTERLSPKKRWPPEFILPLQRALRP